MSRIIAAVFAVVVGLCGLHRPAAAQAWLDQPGVAGTQRVEAGRAVVTLPPGEWVQAEADTYRNAGSDSSVDRKVLFQFIDGKLHAAALIESGNQGLQVKNWGGQLYGWHAPQDCSRRDVFFYDNKDEQTGYFDCMMVNHYTMAPSAYMPWSDAQRFAGQHGGWPRPMIGATFSASGPAHQHYLLVRIYVDPALAGFAGERTAWQDSAWHPASISDDRRAYENKVVAWAKAYRPIIEASWL